MDELLTLLLAAEQVSGETVSRALGISRAAVWKRVEKLRAQGIDIRSAGRGGYRLGALPDVPLPALLQARLATKWAGRTAYYFEELDSTNAEAKRLARQGAPEGALVVADAQTAGRGRRGRSWASAPGLGLWSTLVLRPNVPAERVPSLAMVAALAVADVCAEWGLVPGIKWPNDVLIEGKKVCGILLELSADMDGVQWVVCGIGLNVAHRAEDFPPELRETATSLAQAKEGDAPARVPLLAALLAAFERRYEAWLAGGLPALWPDYTARSVTLGQPVRVVEPGGEFCGTATRVDETGALWVRLNGQEENQDNDEERRVLAADVSVRTDVKAKEANKHEEHPNEAAF